MLSSFSLVNTQKTLVEAMAPAGTTLGTTALADLWSNVENQQECSGPKVKSPFQSFSS